MFNLTLTVIIDPSITFVGIIAPVPHANNLPSSNRHTDDVAQHDTCNDNAFSQSIKSANLVVLQCSDRVAPFLVSDQQGEKTTVRIGTRVHQSLPVDYVIL